MNHRAGTDLYWADGIIMDTIPLGRERYTLQETFRSWFGDWQIDVNGPDGKRLRWADPRRDGVIGIYRAKFGLDAR